MTTTTNRLLEDFFGFSWDNYVERVHSLLPESTGEPVFYNGPHMWETVAVPALQVATVLYVFHFAVMVPFCGRYLLCNSNQENSDKSDSNDNNKVTLHRLAFTATNFLVNFALTVLGFYLESDDRRRGGYSDVTQRLGGHEYITFLPSWQVGVQLWSFPIGWLMIQEDTVMLLHHVALVWTAILPCCMHVGYRWHVPFFFGIFELSSLPLGVMNMFKAHPTWTKEYPDLYGKTRVVFAVAFLVVRILWCVPRMLLYMLDQATYAYGLSSSLHYNISLASAWPLLLLQVYLVLNFIGAALLLWMQFLWGSKVAAGLARNFLGKSSSHHHNPSKDHTKSA